MAWLFLACMAWSEETTLGHIWTLLLHWQWRYYKGRKNTVGKSASSNLTSTESEVLNCSIGEGKHGQAQNFGSRAWGTQPILELCQHCEGVLAVLSQAPKLWKERWSETNFRNRNVQIDTVKKEKKGNSLYNLPI